MSIVNNHAKPSYKAEEVLFAALSFIDDDG